MTKFKIGAIFFTLIFCLALTTEGMVIPLQEYSMLFKRSTIPETETGLINRPEMPSILTGGITREKRSNPWPRGSPVYRYPNRGFTPIGGP